jgi:hypothetical protein
MDTPETTPTPEITAAVDLQPVQTPAGDQPPISVKHTYPDGCEVFGVPPFPDQSPIERAAKILRDASADLIAAQQANAVAAEAAAKAVREAEAAKVAVAAAAVASTQPAGIVTAADVQQSPDPLPTTPAA